jgi:signal transduction histidine kinase
MTSRSLRLRLLMAAGAAIFAALALSWLALTLLFERHIERQVEADLEREARQLVAGLSVATGGGPVASLFPADTRFAQPASGRYWQLSSAGNSSPSAAARAQGGSAVPGTEYSSLTDPARMRLKSRSLFDENLPAPTEVVSEEWRTRVARGPFEQNLLLLERVVQPDRAGARILVQLAQDRAAIEESRRAFARELAVYLLLLWVVLALAAWLQVHLGLRPLQHLRSQVASLRGNASSRLTADHPQEVQPLTEAINELAEARERDLESARRRAADLAHGLKTPLAALAAQSRRAREAGAVVAAEGLDKALSAARAAVEAELARSRLARTRAAADTVSANVSEVAERIIAVVERTDFGADRVFEVVAPEDMTVPLAPEDLAELLGALIENAARHASRRVRVSGLPAASAGQHARGNVEKHLIVEDDGAGLDPARAAALLERGVRLDESGPGHGLGFSIAQELVRATGGTFHIDVGDLGGLRVTASWPAVRAA